MNGNEALYPRAALSGDIVGFTIKPPVKSEAFSTLCSVLEHFSQDDRARLLAAAALLYVWEPEAEAYLARSFRSKGSP